MEHKYRRIERRFLTAFVYLVGQIICADRCISGTELKTLQELEDRFGFGHALMAEASNYNLADAVACLKEMDPTILKEMLEALHEMALADRVIERNEALLLLALRCCMSKDPAYSIVSSSEADSSLNYGGCILYAESSCEEVFHQELNTQWELLQLLLLREGFQLIYIDRMVKEIAALDEKIVHMLLGYMAPRMTDEQIDDVQRRMKTMDSATFCERILDNTLHLKGCRNTRPCLLVGIDSCNFLKIELKDTLQYEVRRLLEIYDEIATHSLPSSMPASGRSEFLYDGYGKLFFSMLVKAEPHKSSLILWPNKSEFEFPEVGCKLQLNQQEASLYTLILLRSLTGEGRGLPLAYCAESKRIETLYRTIYCRKKLIESSEVTYPDNLAPIRARIEKKMREQLCGLENLEDYIPYNLNHEGFYRVLVPAAMVMVKPDMQSEPVALHEYKW